MPDSGAPRPKGSPLWIAVSGPPDWLSLLLLLAVSLLQQKGSVRDKIGGYVLPVRWALWYALLFAVILLGCYGPGYSAGEFIYQGF